LIEQTFFSAQNNRNRKPENESRKNDEVKKFARLQHLIEQTFFSAQNNRKKKLSN